MFVFIITKYLKSPNPCLGLIHSNISTCNLPGISRLGYTFGGVVSVSLTDPGLRVSESRPLSREAMARIQEGLVMRTRCWVDRGIVPRRCGRIFQFSKMLLM